MADGSGWTAEVGRLNQKILDLVFGCRNYEDLCRSFVHSELTEGCVQGAHLFTLNQEADLEIAASYGRRSDLIEDSIYGWGSHPCAESIRKMKPIFLTPEPNPILAVPLAKDNYPNGCLALLLDPERETSPLPMSLFSTLSKVGGFFLGTRATNSDRSKGLSTPGTGTLSSRQLAILELMAKKMTNGQIAKQILVSESTVRQETIRIFRSLSAVGRVEAVQKAAEFGLITQI